MNNTNFYDTLHIVENVIYFVNEIYKNSNKRNTILKKNSLITSTQSFLYEIFY